MMDRLSFSCLSYTSSPDPGASSQVVYALSVARRIECMRYGTDEEQPYATCDYDRTT